MLKDDPEEALSTYAKPANLGLFKANASFNNTVAAKSSKRFHFPGSGVTSFRVAAQKNVGTNYLRNVYLREENMQSVLSTPIPQILLT